VRWLILFLILATIAVVALRALGRKSPSTAEETQTSADTMSRFERQRSGRGVLVFVHGALGNPRQTWTCPSTGTYWSSLVAKDPAFDSFDMSEC
jgi:hypothetical protein